MPFSIQDFSATILFTTEDSSHKTNKKVFRLPDHLTNRAFPFRLCGTVALPAAFIPGYGDGSATAFHRLPFYGLFGLLFRNLHKANMLLTSSVFWSRSFIAEYVCASITIIRYT